MNHRTKQKQAPQPANGKLSSVLVTFWGQYTGGCVSANSQTTYVNCSLMQSQSRSVFSVWLGHLCFIPLVSGPASSSSLVLLLLRMGSVTMAICSDSIEVEIRGIGGHMVAGAKLKTPPLSAFHFRLHCEIKWWKDNERWCLDLQHSQQGADHQLVFNNFYQCNQ